MRQICCFVFIVFASLIIALQAGAKGVTVKTDIASVFVNGSTNEETIKNASEVLLASYSNPRMRRYGKRRVSVRKGLPKQRAGLPKQRSRLTKQRAGLPNQGARLPKQRAALPKQDARLPKQRANLPRQRKSLNIHQSGLPSIHYRIPTYNSKPRRYRGSLHISY